MRGDSVDELIHEWRVAAPDLETWPIEIINRLRIVDTRISAELDSVFASYGLSRASFAVLSTLIRSYREKGATQKRLAVRLGLTAGTMSVRLERMERDDLIVRRDSTEDARSTIIKITEKGVSSFERCVPAYLDMQARIVSSLTEQEQDLMASLLRKLVVGTDSELNRSWLSELGIRVSTTREAIELQRRLGLPEKQGLLVEYVDDSSLASEAGLKEGDLIYEIDGDALRSTVTLSALVVNGSVTLGVMRQGKSVSVRLQNRSQRDI